MKRQNNLKKNSMKEILRNKILLNFKNFSDLEEIIEEKKNDLQKEKEELKSGKVDNLEEKVNFFQDFYVNYTLLVNDSRVIFTRLFFMIDLYKEMNYNDLPENVVEFYNKNRIFVPKETFFIKNGKVAEIEEGSLQKERENFLNSDFFKTLLNTETPK